jgi:hypothetical protein
MLELLEMRGDAAFHRRHTPDLPEALELLEPGEVAPGDWADLRNTYRLTDLPTCFDTAAIYQADEEHPGRLWPVVEVSFLTVRIDLGAVQVLRLRRQLGRVWRAKVSTPAERVLRGRPLEVVPPAKSLRRDALGRGRGDLRRGAVRSVTLTRKRKGGGIWTGEQHQLQWEEGGAKKTRYLRKAIASKVKADWEAGATVKELLEKYKLVEPKHG